MTFAPRTLRDVAAYWTSQGGVNLGIVGDTGHALVGTSYHLGRDQLDDGAYSAVLPRDKAGLSNAASAIDLGKLNGSLAKLQAFSRHLVSWCLAGAPGSRDIREIIYTPNGRLPIHRYSALDRRVYTGPGSGDSSHLTHTHISYWRDSEFRDKREPFRAYFEEPPDTSTGGPLDMPGVETRNPRAGEWELTVKRDGVEAIVIHSGAKVLMTRGSKKRGVMKLYVPAGGQDGYVMADEDPTSPDPAAVVLAADVEAVPAATDSTLEAGAEQEKARLRMLLGL